MLSTLSVGTTTNTGHINGSQSETAIAINPTNTNNIVALANDNSAAAGEYISISNDGGNTWSARQILQTASNGLPASCCDGTLAFDSFGNLFLGYIDSSASTSVLALSTDGGNTFSLVGTVPSRDQPKVATGPGHTPGTQSVWMEYAGSDGNIGAIGTETTGLGKVGAVTAPKVVPGSAGTNFGKLSVGPAGQVMVSFQDNTGIGGPASIYISVDANGIGGVFSQAQVVTTTNVGGFDYISAQATRSVDAEAGLAYDISSSQHRGRVYLVYTDAGAPGLSSPGTPTADQNNTDILVRYSDNDGKTWSSPLKVNDDTGKASQFFPRVAVDPTSGIVGFSWYDTRNDPTNATMTPYATVSIDSGLTVVPNVQVWNSPSNSALAPNANSGNDFGDYSGLSFYNGVLRPIWADNSPGLPGNTDRPELDIATAPIFVSTLKITAPPISATELTQFSGVVATITPSTSGLTPSAFVTTIDWGDGTVTPGSVSTSNNGKTFDVTASHIYNLGGTYTVTISATQSGIFSASTTTTATVTGLPINATGTSFKLNEGDGYSGILAHFVDTAPVSRPASFYSATINFGDGTLGTGTIVASPSGGFDVYDQGGHIYGGGTYPVTITISDPGTTTQAIATAIVTDSALHATGLDVTPTEGALTPIIVATFTDDDPRIPPLSNYYASIDWGDGTVSTGSALTIIPNIGGLGFAVQSSHAYGVGSYSIVVTIGNFSGGNSAVALSTADVQDAPLTAQGYGFTRTAGTTFTGFVASFTDADPRNNPTSNYVAKVDWGDGTKQTATVVINEDGGYLVQGSHAYRAGSYTITTTISDLGGAQVDAVAVATIPDAPITLVGLSNASVGEAQAISTNYASFTTANLLSQATDYSATIALPDGTILPATVSLVGTLSAGTSFVNLFSVSSDAPYSTAGSYPFNVVVTSPGGSQVQAGGNLTVTAAPVSAVAALVSGVSKTTLSGITVATFTSANPNALSSAYTATIGWGDGTTSVGAIQDSGLGGFLVVGTHVYSGGGTFITAVTINGSGGITSTVQGVASISNLITPISGGATTGSGGAISQTGLTNSSTPIFAGKTEPFADVKVLVNASNGSTVMVATGTADATGAYSIPSNTVLPDGQYTVIASATDHSGNPSSNPTVLYPTASRGPLTVDTQGPKVNLAKLDARTGSVTIGLTDALAGLGAGSLQAGNYSLQSSTGKVYAVTGISVSPVSPNTSQTIKLSFATNKPLPKGTYILRINAQGITDNAGNLLDERYFVPFPSLYNQPGQNYVASFQTNGKVASLPTQFVPPNEVIAAKNHRLFVRKHFRR